jgi:hypothetical protein
VNFNYRFFLGKCEIVATCWPTECSDMLTVTNESLHERSLQINVILLVVYLKNDSSTEKGG